MQMQMSDLFKGFLTDIGIDRKYIEWFASPIAMERFQTCEEGNLKLCYERIMLAQAIRNFREVVFFSRKTKEEIDNYIQYRCKDGCDGLINIEDEFGGHFIYTCNKINASYCLLSQFNRETIELKQNTLEVFKPNVIPFEYQIANIKGVNAGIKVAFNKYLKEVLESGITIYGSTGNGKTSLFYLAIKELLLKKEIPYFLTISQFFTAILKENEIVVKKLLDSKYLFIDDVGTEYKQEFATSQFDTIICDRYARGLFTSFTMNLSDGQFKKNYPRIYDRQKKTNKGFQIIGPSMRGK
jgi:DNA replication protein DnaC